MAEASSKRNWQLFVAILIVALLALLFGIWSHYNVDEVKRNKPLELTSATVLPHPRVLSEFTLTDQNNKPFTNQNLKGHWSLVFFGFTHCPQLCPTTLAELNQIYQSLEKDGQKPMPQIVFISVDPERDTPAQISKYLISFNKNFMGATGDEQQIEKLTQEFGVLAMKVADPNAQNSDDYMIDHSGAIIIINPEGQFYGIFNTPHDTKKIVQDLTQIMQS